MSAPAAERPADAAPALALVRGLRVASSVIVLAILLGLVLPHLVADRELYRPAWTGPAWFAALLAVALADAALTALRRPWGGARWPAAAVVLAASVGATAVLPPSALVGPAHQTLGAVGWFGVLLLADRGVAHVVGFLAVHVALTLAQLGAAGRLDTTTLVALAVVLAATGGFQVTTGAAGAALTRMARAAAGAARRQAATATAEAVARRLHLDREERYAALRESVLPLLRGVGDGSLSPAAPDVQRRAALEAARLRRMFAEEGDVSDPLATELAALIDVVERRGVEVRYAVRGRRPVPPPAARRALLEAVGAVLLAVDRSARVTLSGVGAGATGTGVAVSVVVDGAPPAVGDADARAANAAFGASDAPDAASAPPGREDITTVTVVDEDRTWVEARWTPSQR